MNILVIDDFWLRGTTPLAARIALNLRADGFTANAIIPAGFDPDGHNLQYLNPDQEARDILPASRSAALRLIAAAQVIFLDHRMPGMDGRHLMKWLEGQEVRLSDKRIIGISEDDPQRYLPESVAKPRVTRWIRNHLPTSHSIVAS